MIWILIVAIGFLSMYQGGLNRLVGLDWGLPGSILINGIVFLVASLMFFMGVHYGWIPNNATFQNIAPFKNFKLWYLLPGLFGFAFVLGVPIAISRVGASLTFIALVIAQVAAGASWDYFFENRNMDMQKWIGLVVACVGIWIATRTKTA